MSLVGKTVSHFKIIEKIGQGGMGVVYKAEDTKLKRLVALKFLSSVVADESDAKARLVREAQAAAALEHPNIAPVYEIAEFEEQIYIVMAYIQGVDLKRKIKSGPLSVEEALDISIQIAYGLKEAHERGIVHRDIKSANVMITKKGQVKITDFGLAKFKGDKTLTKSGTQMGTTAYMSPEQLRGELVDYRSDIFSFGGVLYEMLSGQLPFQKEDDPAVMLAILYETPKSINALRPELSAELESIVTKALEKDKEQRYQSADELLADLQQLKTSLTEGQLIPVNEGKASIKKWGNKTRKSLRTKPYHYSGIASFLVLLIGTWLYFSTWRNESIDSVAVLPFVNVSNDPNTEYLSDGITESLIYSLSRLPDLKVIARSSVFRYKGQEIDLQAVAQKLDVRAVVTGRVVQQGEILSISAELVNAQDNRLIWGQQYKGTFTGLLSLQEELVQEITDKLRLRLTGEEAERLTRHYIENSEAYQLYLKGRYFWNKWAIDAGKKAIEHFRQAIEIDPTYAQAYGGLADAYTLLGELGAMSPKEAYPKAKAWAEKALQLDEQLAEAHASLARINMRYYWNWPEVESHFQRVIELNPNYATARNWYAEYLRWMGRFDEAIVEGKHARALDPLSFIINWDLGFTYYESHQYDKALEEFQKTVEMFPNIGYAHFGLGFVYVRRGMYEEATSAFQKARTLSGDVLDFIALQGYTYAVAGKSNEALNILRELQERAKKRYVPPFVLATIYVGLGEKDKAFEYLEKAYEDRNWYIITLKVDPMFDPLRSDPRFNRLLKKVGLGK